MFVIISEIAHPKEGGGKVDQGQRMTRERFSEILEEYGFTDHQIEILWDSKPSDDLSESKLRETAEAIVPIKDQLVQT